MLHINDRSLTATGRFAPGNRNSHRETDVSDIKINIVGKLINAVSFAIDLHVPAPAAGAFIRAKAGDYGIANGFLCGSRAAIFLATCYDQQEECGKYDQLFS